VRIALDLSLLLAGAPGLHAAWDPDRSPWPEASPSSVPLPGPVWLRLADAQAAPPDLVPLPRLLGADLLWVYQRALSGSTGATCPYYPTCSRFSRIAVQRHGLLWGSLLTADRLSRCHAHADERHEWPRLERDGRRLLVDFPSGLDR
jgi:putative membrane protein insertion efficiency factor